MTPLVAYVVLFVAVGVAFIFVHLVAGKFLRPSRPGTEKATIYECGEPTIGSAWIQFDLRFYVVALLFVIFDVEVAFFFPWAEVFGKANGIAATNPADVDAAQVREFANQVLDLTPPYSEQQKTRREFENIRDNFTDLQERIAADQKLQNASRTPEERAEQIRLSQEWYNPVRRTVSASRELSWLAFGEIFVFFGVLLVGFAYLWKRGDLAWVRSTLAERPSATAVPTNGAVPSAPPAPAAAPEPVVTAGGHP
jgi:NADH-quinone oxidoreductase subunit A